MNWHVSHAASNLVRPLADRHYNRQNIGAIQFCPPGRKLVLRSSVGAFWVTSWPFAEYVKHAWAGAWVCSAFRNEGTVLSSLLIREAVAATRYTYGDPPRPHGFISFVDAE